MKKIKHVNKLTRFTW